jgi:glycosyltransferase involved in cell wall biosynthesis
MSILVSIITPMYNSENFIDATIQSVQSQTYQDWEMIIVDDASTDRSIEIVKKIMSNEPRLQLKQIAYNLGPAHARNNGIKLAKGRFLAFLDSDDLWHEEKLYKQLKFMKKNHYAFTYTGFEKINEEGKVLGAIIPYKEEVCYYDLLKSNHIGCLTAMIDLKILGYKIYMPDIKKRQDQGLWLKILK